MLRQAHKVGPTSLAARSGTTKTMTIIGPRCDAGKAQPQQDAASPSTWPRPDHPFFHQLRADSNFVWCRMLSSVSREYEVLRPC